MNQECGFMKDFDLLSVTVSNDGCPLNGDGIAYYKKGYEQYTLRARWVYGKKEGNATLYDSHNVVCAQLTFQNDEVTGPCIIRDGNGIVRFRGNMVNGVKDGFCDEFNESGVRIFSGYYNNQEKYSLFRPREGLVGFCEEYSADGSLLTIAEYDSHLTLKHGCCFFFENGVVVRCEIMNKGKSEYVYAEFKGDTMTIFNSRGKIQYEGNYNHDVNTLFCKQGYGREYNDSGEVVYEGPFDDDQRLWVIEEKSNWRIVRECSSKAIVQVYQVDAHDVRMGRCSYFENNHLTKVTKWVNGRELRTMISIFCDVMRVYGDDGELRYEGGFKDSNDDSMWTWVNREGEGIEYLDDGITVVYRGHFSKNKRHGKGIWYSQGLPCYTGEWKDDSPNGYGTLMNENGIPICDGTWEWGYLFTSNGWVDYETRTVLNVDKTELPKWGLRGGVTLLGERSLRHDAICLGCFVHFLNLVDLIFFIISMIFCGCIVTYLFFTHRSYGWFRWSLVLGFVIFILEIISDVKSWLRDDDIQEWVLPFYPFYRLYLLIGISSIQFFIILDEESTLYFLMGMSAVSLVAVFLTCHFAEIFYHPILVETLNGFTLVGFTYYLKGEPSSTIGMIISIILFVISLFSFLYSFTCYFHPFIDAIFYFVILLKSSTVVLYGGIGFFAYMVLVVVFVVMANTDYYERSLVAFYKKRRQWLYALSTIDTTVCPDDINDKYDCHELDDILMKHVSWLSRRFLLNIPRKWYLKPISGNCIHL